MEHLLEFPSNWCEKIILYVEDTIGKFYSKIQKNMNEKRKFISNRIKRMIDLDCDTYEGKQHLL